MKLLNLVRSPFGKSASGARKVFHARNSPTSSVTYCGADCVGWEALAPRDADDVVEDNDLCRSCAKELHPFRFRKLSGRKASGRAA